MSLFQALLFLILGVYLLALDFIGWRNGSIPFGHRGFHAFTNFSKIDQPLRFWLVFAFYSISGLCALIFSLSLFIGFSSPLPFK